MVSVPPPFSHVTVIGIGLIGGSLAMAIKSRFPEIHLQAVDPNGEALQFALKSGVADGVSLDLPASFQGDHLIVLACHLSTSLELLPRIAERVAGQPSLTVTDIGSCKRQVCRLGAELLPDQFIGGHPMAGRETTGIQNGTPLLFAEKRYILCPSAETPPEALEKLETLLKGIGSTVKHLDPDTHDRIMAYVSHFPQLYATLLSGVLKQNKPTQLMQYQGAGLDDQMRLAGSPYAMWKDVFAFNADNLSQVLRQFIERATLAQSVLPSAPPEEGTGNGLDVSLASLFADANEMYRTWIDFKQNPIVASK